MRRQDTPRLRCPPPIKAVQVHTSEVAEPLKFAEYRIVRVSSLPSLVKRLSLSGGQFGIKQKRNVAEATEAFSGAMKWRYGDRYSDLLSSVRQRLEQAERMLVKGRYAEARKLFGRLLSRCNDVGLLSEEIDPLTGRMLGNFPQAYSHVGLINCALNLSRQLGPVEERAESQARRVPDGLGVSEIG